MKLKLFLTSVLFVFLFANQACAVDWYNTDWDNRFKVTVNNSLVDGTIVDFPVTVDLDQLAGGHGFWSNVNSSGDDIRVTETDGTTEVPVEVVFLETASENGEMYFKATGTLSSTEDTDFYVYYGNSTVAAYAQTATYGQHNVWTNYDFVYHMYGASATAIDNSASNSCDVTGVKNTPDFNQTGDIGKAVYCNGGEAVYADCGSSAAWSTEYYMFMSFNADSIPDTDTTSVFGHDPAINRGYYHTFDNNHLETQRYGSGWRINEGAATVSTGSWVTRTFYYNTSDDVQHGYYNGGDESTLTNSNNTSMSTSNPTWVICSRRHNTPQQAWAGYVGEFRIGKDTNVQSDEYVATEDESYRNVSLFLTLGSEESQGVAGATFYPIM